MFLKAICQRTMALDLYLSEYVELEQAFLILNAKPERKQV